MQRRYISCDPQICTGCQLCEFACSAVKTGEFNIELSRIKLVRLKSDLMMSLTCRFCEDAPCIAACPRQALSWDEEQGIIILNKVRCTGCGWCLEACDFGAITIDPHTKSALICDLCVGREEPRCVEVCPKEALKITSFEVTGQEARLKAMKRLSTE